MKTLNKNDIEEGKKLLRILNGLSPIGRVQAVTYINALGDQQKAQEIIKEESEEKKESEVI